MGLLGQLHKAVNTEEHQTKLLIVQYHQNPNFNAMYHMREEQCQLSNCNPRIQISHLRVSCEEHCNIGSSCHSRSADCCFHSAIFTIELIDGAVNVNAYRTVVTIQHFLDMCQLWHHTHSTVLVARPSKCWYVFESQSTVPKLHVSWKLHRFILIH